MVELQVSRFIVTTFLLLVLSSWSSIFGQSLEAKLEQRLVVYQTDKSTSLEQLIELGQRYYIPMGIEWIDSLETKGGSQNPSQSGPVELKDTTPRKVIAHILGQNPGYKFSLERGVVNISNAQWVDDPRNVLTFRFPYYGVENSSLGKASYWLAVAIKRTLHPERNMGGGIGGQSKEAGFNNPVITFAESDISVRQILNKFVILEGSSLWVVHLQPSVLMDGEPFFAQRVSLDTGKGSSSFVWDFFPFNKVPKIDAASESVPLGVP